MDTGYAFIVFALLSVLWMSSTEAESFLQDRQPCSFNPLCSCTKSYDNLGEVHCVDVYFPRLPPAINRSKLFALHLRNNDLDGIEPYFFVNTGKSQYWSNYSVRLSFTHSHIYTCIQLTVIITFTLWCNIVLYKTD